MTEIIIKSFNRPYYLERCLKSIYMHIRGNFEVIILDDGTPPEYLNKLALAYPRIDIRRSVLYHRKVQAIEDCVNKNHVYDYFSIPAKFWRDEIKRTSEFFLLLEDDIWITSDFDIDNLTKIAANLDIVMTKIGWSGNNNVNIGKLDAISPILKLIQPQLPITSHYLYSLISNNKYKLKSLLYRLGVIDDGFDLPYYTLYYVASALYKKDYWLSIWHDAGNKINENVQLTNALGWYNKYTESKFAKTNDEFCKTSFISSATNMFEGISLNIIVFNHYLNEAWLKGRLKSMENFPNDFSIEYVRTILDEANDVRCTSQEWLKWVEVFKSQYIKMGCNVE